MCLYPHIYPCWFCRFIKQKTHTIRTIQCVILMEELYYSAWYWSLTDWHTVLCFNILNKWVKIGTFQVEWRGFLTVNQVQQKQYWTKFYVEILSSITKIFFTDQNSLLWEASGFKIEIYYYKKPTTYLLKSCMDRSLMYSPVVISELRSGITGVPKYIISLQLSM